MGNSSEDCEVKAAQVNMNFPFGKPDRTFGKWKIQRPNREKEVPNAPLLQYNLKVLTYRKGCLLTLNMKASP